VHNSPITGSGIYGKRNLRFSPIEILCALGVMLILFVVFFRIYVYRDNHVEYQIAREELSILNCALEYYHTSCGEYPVGNQRLIEQHAISMYTALTKSSKNFLTGHEWKIASNNILDLWGRPYI
jgi:hypothetical protein